jgi:hypothetical protein
MQLTYGLLRVEGAYSRSVSWGDNGLLPEEDSGFYMPAAQSNLWTARSRRVLCGLIKASFSGLRHFGQVSSMKRSKDRVRLVLALGDVATE